MALFLAFQPPLETTTSWRSSIQSKEEYPGLSEFNGFFYFYVFFCFDMVALLCYIFFSPETKDKTLEQMNQLFGDQLVPHALQDPEAANAAEMEMNISRAETTERR